MRPTATPSEMRMPVLAAPPLRPQRRVVVTGLGAVTPLAVGVQRTWERLVAGDVAVGALESPAFAPLPSRVAACVPRGKGAGQFNVEDHVDKAQVRAAGIDFIAFGLAAAGEAMRDAGLGAPAGAAAAVSGLGPYSPDRFGVALGSGIGGLGDVASAAESMVGEPSGRKLSPFFVPRILVNMAAGHVSIAWGLRGPVLAPATACATGAHAIGDAFRAIKHGWADAMVAGGTEACVHPLALAGFSRAKALSTRHNGDPAQASRPFDAGRDGFVLGEGAGALLLEEREAALARGARIYAELRGYGAAGDAHHITSPADDGSGALRVMALALEEGGLEAGHVAYVNAHATSTPAGDVIEARAIDRLLQQQQAEGGSAGGGRPLVSSTKGAIGHLLGAAGAVEAVAAVMALHTGVAPPSVNLVSPDYAPAHYDYAVAPATPLPPGRPAVLTNSFGFGGTYSALAFSVA